MCILSKVDITVDIARELLPLRLEDLGAGAMDKSFEYESWFFQSRAIRRAGLPRPALHARERTKRPLWVRWVCRAAARRRRRHATHRVSTYQVRGADVLEPRLDR